MSHNFRLEEIEGYYYLTLDTYPDIMMPFTDNPEGFEEFSNNLWGFENAETSFLNMIERNRKYGMEKYIKMMRLGDTRLSSYNIFPDHSFYGDSREKSRFDPEDKAYDNLLHFAIDNFDTHLVPELEFWGTSATFDEEPFTDGSFGIREVTIAYLKYNWGMDKVVGSFRLYLHREFEDFAFYIETLRRRFKNTCHPSATTIRNRELEKAENWPMNEIAVMTCLELKNTNFNQDKIWIPWGYNSLRKKSRLTPSWTRTNSYSVGTVRTSLGVFGVPRFLHSYMSYCDDKVLNGYYSQLHNDALYEIQNATPDDKRTIEVERLKMERTIYLCQRMLDRIIEFESLRNGIPQQEIKDFLDSWDYKSSLYEMGDLF